MNLNFNGVNTFIDILCKNSVGELVGIEIKTGDTDYTENQKIVYPHAILGLGVVSSDMRIVQLGYQQWEPLPALDIQIIYSKTPGAPFTALSLRDLMFSKGV